MAQKEKNIIVNSRKDFMYQFRDLFIKNCSKDDSKFFDFGKAIYSWTMFFIHIQDDQSKGTTYDLVQEELKKNKIYDRQEIKDIYNNGTWVTVELIEN